MLCFSCIETPNPARGTTDVIDFHLDEPEMYASSPVLHLADSLTARWRIGAYCFCQKSVVYSVRLSEVQQLGLHRRGSAELLNCCRCFTANSAACEAGASSTGAAAS